MQRRETRRTIHSDPALWPQGQQARLRVLRRYIAVAGTALLLLSGNVAVSGTSAATLTSTPPHNTRDIRGYSTGTPGSVFVTATETATATATIAVTATNTPTTATPVITTAITTATTATAVTSATAATVVTTAPRTFVAQPLIAPDASPMHTTATPMTTTIMHPNTTAPASTSGAGTAVIQPISPASASSPAGTNAVSATATATALRTPNAITASASAMRTTTAIASGTANATNGAKASLTPAATTTATVTVTATARPPRNSGLALLGPPMTIAATAEDIANGGSVVIARVALRHLGEFTRPDGVPWAGWCEMFVGNVADEAGMFHTRFPSALTDSYAATLFRGQAPAGSLVFFDQRSDLYGHVGIALGDGTMISALGPGISRTAYEQWGSYIGWRPYPGLGTGHATAKAATDATHAAIPEALSPAPTRGGEEGEHTQPEVLSPAPSQGDEESGYAINEIAPCQTP